MKTDWYIEQCSIGEIVWITSNLLNKLLQLNITCSWVSLLNLKRLLLPLTLIFLIKLSIEAEFQCVHFINEPDQTVIKKSSDGYISDA